MNIFVSCAVAASLPRPAILCPPTFAAEAGLWQAHSLPSISPFLADMDISTFGVIVLIAVVIVVLGAVRAKKRREALQSVATQLGYTFEKDGDNLDESLSPRLHIFKLGKSHRLYNVLRGSCTTGDIALFEFEYTTNTGSAQDGVPLESKHRQTIAAFKLRDTVLPEFQLGPKHWWDKVGQMFGYQVITFDTHPRFGERYLLRGISEDAVRQFFRPSLLEYLQALPEKPAWTLEAAAPWLLVHQPAVRPKPEELPTFRDAAVALVSDIVKNAEIIHAAQVARA